MGSPEDNNDKGNNAGAVYVYQFQNGQWIETHKIMASDGDSYHNLGWSVDIDEQYVITGAYHYDPDHGDSEIGYPGAVYIYSLSLLPENHNQRYAPEVVVKKESKSVADNDRSTDNVSTILNDWVYPNPIQYQINVLFGTSLEGPVHVTITDASNKAVFNQSVMVDRGKLRIDLNGKYFSKGIYYLHLETSGQIKKSYRLIKE